MAFETVDIFISSVSALEVIYLTEKVWKFLPEVMTLFYACDSLGDVMSSYVLVKQ